MNFRGVHVVFSQLIRSLISAWFILLSGLFATTICSGQTAPPFTWVDDVASSDPEMIRDVAIDLNTGEVVSVGIFNGDISAWYGFRFNNANGGGFVVKHDSLGNVLWGFPIGNFQDDACLSVAIAPSGNIYVTGYFQQIADFRGMSMSSYTLSSAGGKDVFLAKYNPMGQLIWARRAGGTGDDEGFGVCTNTNSIFITGYYTGNATFGPLSSWTPSLNVKMFVTCYDPNGNAIWLADGGSSQITHGRSVIADANSVYVTGEFSGPTFTLYDGNGNNSATISNASPSTTDAIVLRFLVNGTYAWAKSIFSSGNDRGLAISQSGSKIFVGGSVSAGADFPSWGSNPVAVMAQGSEMFITALSKTFGTTQWVKAETGFGNSDQEVLSLCSGPQGGLYATGYYEDSLQIGTGPLLDAIDSSDVFVLHYDTSGVFDWAKSAGGNRSDKAYGIACSNYDEVYVGGEYFGSSQFDSYLLPFSNDANIFLGKIFCSQITNNLIATTQVVCINTTPTLISGSIPVGSSLPYTYLWEESPDNLIWGAAFGVNTNQNYQPPVIISNTYYRRIVFSSAPCLAIDTSAYILIQIDSLPTPSSAGPDQNICSTTTSMSGNTPTSGTGLWSLYSGTGTIVSPTSPTTNITGLGSGNNIFVWTIANGACPSSTDTVIITRTPPPTPASAGTDQSICSTSFQLQGNIPTNGTGTWTVVNGSGTFGNINLGNSSVSGLSIGLNTFAWTITNSPCASSSDTVQIFVFSPPTTALAGADQQICSTSSSLLGNTPVIGTGMWSVIVGPGTVVSPSNPSTSITGLGVGINRFVWTISNGVCTPSRDTVQVIVNAPPTTANAGADQNICTSMTTLNANAPTIGSGSWTVFSGTGTVTNNLAPNSPVTGMNPGSNIFIWTIVNGVCPPSSDTVVVFIDQPPTLANAGANQTICSTAVQLSGNIPTIGTGTWSLVNGSGNITSPNSPSSSVTALGIGVNVFVWTISNGVCPPSTDTVIITRDPMPSTSSAGPDQTLCASSTQLNAQAPNIGLGQWSLFSGTGTILSPPNPFSGVNGLTPGQNIFIWTVTSGVCPVSTDTVIINVDANPTPAFAGVDQTICNAQITLQGNPPSVGTGTWTLVSGAGNIQNPSANNSVVLSLGPGVNIFAWTISNGTCPPSTDTVVITVFAPPSPSVAGNDINTCSDTATLNAINPVTGIGTWTVISGSGTFANANSCSTFVSNIGTGLNIYRWTVSNGICQPNTDDVNVIVDAFPDPANAGPDQIVHIPYAVLDAADPMIGSGQWEVVTGSGQFANVNDPNSSVSNLQAGVNTYRWIMSNGTCPSDSDLVILRLEPLSIPEGFSPNGDQVNDFFEITGLLEFTGVTLTVLNRWGMEVYHSDNYQNNWDGLSDSGETLADDTYFYILSVPNTDPFKGYLIMKR